MSEAYGSADRDRFFHLSLGADLSELAKARPFLEEVGGVAELSDGRLFNLQVIVSEAVVNAIEHAESKVELTAWVLPDPRDGRDHQRGCLSAWPLQGRQAPAPGFGLAPHGVLADPCTSHE